LYQEFHAAARFPNLAESGTGGSMLLSRLSWERDLDVAGHADDLDGLIAAAVDALEAVRQAGQLIVSSARAVGWVVFFPAGVAESSAARAT
jgi:hypothetical protein